MLTPAQIAELRAASNCFGQTAEGPLFIVRIKTATLKRLQELTILREVTGLVWLHVTYDAGRLLETVVTSNPERLIQLEEQIDAATRAR